MPQNVLWKEDGSEFDFVWFFVLRIFFDVMSGDWREKFIENCAESKFFFLKT